MKFIEPYCNFRFTYFPTDRLPAVPAQGCGRLSFNKNSDAVKNHSIDRTMASYQKIIFASAIILILYSHLASAATGNIIDISNINYIDGEYNNTLENDNQFWAAGRNNSITESLSPAGYFNITYNISGLNLERKDQILNLTINMSYISASHYQ